MLTLSMFQTFQCLEIIFKVSLIQTKPSKNRERAMMYSSDGDRNAIEMMKILPNRDG